MGKDLRGKELGVGICQRKDGLYMARFTGRSGKRLRSIFLNYRNADSGLRMHSLKMSMEMFCIAKTLR